MKVDDVGLNMTAEAHELKLLAVFELSLARSD